MTNGTFLFLLLSGGCLASGSYLLGVYVHSAVAYNWTPPVMPLLLALAGILLGWAFMAAAIACRARNATQEELWKQWREGLLTDEER